MVVLVLAILGGLMSLLGLAVYAALVVGKKTDELIRREDAGEPAMPFLVRYPREVFKPS